MTEIDFCPSILKDYFDLKVAQACRTCKRYGATQCPPNIPNITYYRSLLPSYKNVIIVFERFEIQGDWKEQGRESSLKVHTYLLKKQAQLLNEGHCLSIILGAGSCKLCQTCIIPCRQPDKAIVPLEGCGINVVNLMKNFNIEIKFPIENQKSFYRIGMVLYD
jgi:predicted metal-binding protein